MPSRTACRSPVRPGASEPASQRADAVRVAAEAAAPPHDPPLLADGDDVDAVPPEPGALVEPVRRWPRKLQPRDELQNRALGRRPAHRELEEHRLAHADPTEADEAGRHAQLEAVVAGRPGDDQRRRLRLADVFDQHARVEGVEPRASPPPTRERQRERQGGDSRARVGGERGEPGGAGREHGSCCVHPAGVRSGEPETAATRECVRIGAQQAVAAEHACRSEAALTG